MGTRSRLFASAAFPLLSLSLMLQPAHAALLVDSGAAPSIRHVDDTGAQQIAQAAPAPGDDEQDPKKKKKPAEEPGKEPPNAEKPAEAAKPPKAEKPAEAEAPKPPKAEKPAEQEAPKPPKAAAEPEQAPVKPKAAAPEAAPKAAAEPETPKPPKPGKPAATEQPEAAPAKPRPAATAAPEAQPDTKKPPKPAAEEPAAPAVKPKAETPAAEPAAPAAAPAAPAATPDAPQQPKKHQKPANGEAAPTAEPAAPGAKPPKAQAPAEQVAPDAGKPAEGAKPARPAGEQPPAAADQKPAAVDQKPAAPGTEPPVPPADGKPAPADGATAPQTAPGQKGAAPQAAPTTAGQQVSPAELERRKAIAQNPAAAPAGAGPVILPVQNGTAVLDSDKDAGRRGHGGRPGNGQPGQPGTPGQPPVAGQAAGQAAPDAQRPPAPANVRAPTSDADSQRAAGGTQAAPVKIQAVTSEQGQRMDKRPDFAAPDGAKLGDRQDNRVIINFGNDEFVRHDDTQRFTRDGERPSYEQLPRDRYRETIDRPGGDRIVTVRNRYGDIIQRSRIDARGHEYVLFYSPELEQTPDQDDYYRDPGDALPPMRLRIPLNQYIIDTSEDQDQDYYDFLRKPPVEPVERVYSLNEVRYSARLRDKVRRIDLDTITFATGSADVPMEQAKTLRGIADAIGNIVKKDPTETFLIEGHTDAVGTDQSNLILSDQRAESVANVLTDVYGIPPENLATQGYGEQYLKINTDGPEQENRRVTIRRVTALVRPVAAK